jgi:hypothetical protein
LGADLSSHLSPFRGTSAKLVKSASRESIGGIQFSCIPFGFSLQLLFRIKSISQLAFQTGDAALQLFVSIFEGFELPNQTYFAAQEQAQKECRARSGAATDQPILRVVDFRHSFSASLLRQSRHRN